MCRKVLSTPVFFENIFESGSLPEFVNLLTARCCGIACVFTGNDANGHPATF